MSACVMLIFYCFECWTIILIANSELQYPIVNSRGRQSALIVTMIKKMTKRFPIIVTWYSLVIFCRSVMLDRAETLLHDHYAGKDYWDVSGVIEQY